MKASGLVLVALIAGGAVFTMRGGCLNSEPVADERLAKHFEDMCVIARDNIKTPEKGVRKLGHYLDKHARHIFGDFGDMLATIERIKDDNKHDRRAEQARDRMRRPIIACARDWNRFGEAGREEPLQAADPLQLGRLLLDPLFQRPVPLGQLGGHPLDRRQVTLLLVV